MKNTLLRLFRFFSPVLIFIAVLPAYGQDCTFQDDYLTWDYQALEALYNSTNGESWDNNDGWLQSCNVCNWYGITCGAGKVLSINLQNNNLTGFIPTQIGLPVFISVINLSNNEIGGNIPFQLGNIPALLDLDLSNNQLTGGIPAALIDVTLNEFELNKLNLANNQLSGPIPLALGTLAPLEILNLSGNQFSGSIPENIGDLSILKELRLDRNMLTGSIPSSLGNLFFLRVLDLRFNELTGSIPNQFGELANLKELYLYNNQLSGLIPFALGELSLLERLELNDNQLLGSIPAGLGQLSSLRTLNLYSNQLTGDVPNQLSQLFNLRILNLDNNQLTGDIPNQLSELSNLRTFNLSRNQLTGNIPPELGQLSELRIFDLSNNQLTGNIPSEIGELSELNRLSLGFNELTGTVPASLGNLTGLSSFSLRQNNLNCIHKDLLNLCSNSWSSLPQIYDNPFGPILLWSEFCSLVEPLPDEICDVDLCTAGTPCDDGNPVTVNDVILADCTCLGIAPNIFEGDLLIRSQFDVDAFTYTEVTGTLTIDDTEGLGNMFADITSLNGLSELTTVGGNLRIRNCNATFSLGGITNLTTIGGALNVSNNGFLFFTGLNNLSDIGGGFFILNNQNLISTNISNISSIGENILIFNNASISNVNELSNLTNIESDLTISGNGSLSNIDGLSGLTNIEGNLSISSNASLSNIDGLSNLSNIEGYLSISLNESLSSLDGISNLNTVSGFLNIQNNENLSLCCAVFDLINTPNAVGGVITIQNNNTGCNNFFEITDCPSPCDALNGDADNDGICADDDCDDNDPNLPTAEGTTCDDGDAMTENDVIQSDGCTCQGTAIDPCASLNGDTDNDGVCADDDCNDNDPNLPTTPGSTCDDANSSTENDIIQADGCTCMGTPISNNPCDNIAITTTPNLLTISGTNTTPVSKIQVFTSSWSPVFDCYGNCNDPENITLTPGDYIVRVELHNSSWVEVCSILETVTVSGTNDPCATLGGDADNDGICTDNDCDDNDPNLPATLGTSCDDGDPNTNNDIYQADGCTCEGTPVTGNPCDNIVITTSSSTITVSGTDILPLTKIQVFTTNWNPVFNCFGDCNDPEIITQPAGDYIVKVTLHNANYQEICFTQDVYTIGGNGNPCDNFGGDNDNDGVCAINDCDDNDPTFPMTPGTSCDDNDPDTENDAIQTDGCTCAGTPIGGDPCEDNDVVADAGIITVNGLENVAVRKVQLFDVNWQIIFNCFGNCDPLPTVANLADGLYHIRVGEYTTSYQLICEELQDITITGGSGMALQGTNSENNTHTEEETISSWRLFPNPTSDFITVDLAELAREKATIYIHDHLGTLLIQQEVEANVEELLQFDMSLYPAGVYLLSVKTARYPRRTKIFVKSRL